MLKRFYPSKIIGPLYSFDFDKLLCLGVKAIIFDIDNTLVPDEALLDEKAKRLINELTLKGFTCYVVSNNNEHRVKDFCSPVGMGYIHNAKKPSAEGFKLAMLDMGTDTSNTVVIGDQLLTDIYGANRAGIKSLLVSPTDRINERTHIKFKRKLEKIILKSYKKHKKSLSK